MDGRDLHISVFFFRCQEPIPLDAEGVQAVPGAWKIDVNSKRNKQIKKHIHI
jgi:hypothetical protein